MIRLILIMKRVNKVKSSFLRDGYASHAPTVMYSVLIFTWGHSKTFDLFTYRALPITNQATGKKDSSNS